MTRRKTNVEFVKQVKELVGDEYTFLEPYKTNRTKLYVKHNKCGNTYQVIPDSFLRGRRCPYCSKKKQGISRRKTNAEFIKQVKELVGDDYTFLEPYTTSQAKILVRHNKCGHTMKMKPNNFLNGARCKYCAHNVKLNTKTFAKRVKDAYGNEYEVLGDYVDADTKVLVKHTICGHTYKVRPMNILRGQRCPYCFKTPKKTTAEFQQNLDSLYGKGVYTVLGQYKNAKTKISIKHNLCGNIWRTKPNWMLTGKSGCPYCNTSKGERIITGLFKSSNIDYEYPKKFAGLKGSHDYLHYDFYLPDQNTLIEYQGKQHYAPVDYFGGLKQFKIQQEHDKLKREYARKHGYKLIEIPYTIDTRDGIKKFLIKSGLTLD